MFGTSASLLLLLGLCSAHGDEVRKQLRCAERPHLHEIDFNYISFLSPNFFFLFLPQSHGAVKGKQNQNRERAARSGPGRASVRCPRADQRVLTFCFVFSGPDGEGGHHDHHPPDEQW